MEKQRARTNEEKELRRQVLLASAKKIFSGNGFQGTKINMITKDAGLSPAAFYLYFKSKVEVYRLLAIEGTRILTQRIETALASQSGSSASRLANLARTYFDFFLQEREFYDIITVHHLGQNVFFTNMNLVPQLESLSLNLLKLLANIIEEGVRAGEFKAKDCWKAAVTLWGMMDGVLLMEVRQTTRYVDLDIKTLTEQYLELSLCALKK